MRAALVQLTSGDDPGANLPVTRGYVAAAAAEGATLICTPEVTNCVSQDRARQRAVLRHEDDDPTLAALREDAARLGVWIAIGSLAVKTDDADGRFANRSLLIGPDGGIAARYDKIHMFDVTVSETESYRESSGYRPGTRATLADTPWGRLGMMVCYDIRFPSLYRRLAQAGASFLSVPSAFSPVTGAAHWETLLRARAIETGCFVLAPAQTGEHATSGDRPPRRTHGHSMIVSPWGEILLDGGTDPGAHVTDIDPDAVAKARARIPSLTADPRWEGP